MKMYQALRLTFKGTKHFMGQAKGYKNKEDCLKAVERQLEFEKHLPNDEYRSVKVILRTYELVSEEEL